MTISSIHKSNISHNYQYNLDYYDYIYSDHLQYSNHLLDTLAPILKKNNINSVFDACCGSGNDIERLYKNGFFVNGSDICVTMVDFAVNRLQPNNIKKSLFITCNVLDLSKYCKNKYDLVLFRGNTLGHLTFEEQKKAIDELIKITNPNGLILIDFRDGLKYFNSKKIYEQRGVGIDKKFKNIFFSFYKMRFPSNVSMPYTVKTYLFLLNYRKLNFVIYAEEIKANFVLKKNVMDHIFELGLKHKFIDCHKTGLPYLESLLIYNKSL